MSSELELSNEFASIGVSGFAGGALVREKRGDPCPPVRCAQGWGLKAIRGYLVHSRRPDLRLECRILQKKSSAYLCVSQWPKKIIIMIKNNIINNFY